jgi:hypothetical protein
MEVSLDHSHEVLPYIKVEDSEQNASTFDSVANIREISQEELEAHLKYVRLKMPQTAFNIFKKDHWNKDKTMAENNAHTSKMWKSLPKNENEKYRKMEAEEKVRFSEHRMWLKTHILQTPYDNKASAFEIFREHLPPVSNKKDKKELTKLALELWLKMTDDEKKIYEEKSKKNSALYDEISKIPKKINPYVLFINDQMSLAREIGVTKTLLECASIWKSLKPFSKMKYYQSADELKIMKEALRDQSEMVYKIRPKRSLSAYQLFLSDLSKNKKFKNFKEASILWKSLSAKEKDQYLKISHKAKLAYSIKKAEYDLFVKKNTKRAPSAFNLFCADIKERKFQKNQEVFGNCFSEWKRLDIIKRAEYVEKSKKAKDMISQENKNRLSDKPVRPANGYARFIKESCALLKIEQPSLIPENRFKLAISIWKNISKEQKDKYKNEFKNDMLIYHQQMREYNEKGFYTIIKQRQDDERLIKVEAESSKKGKPTN